MANPEHLRVLKLGPTVWNEWRKERPTLRADLTEANLREARLNGADLSKADLNRAILDLADFRAADLSGASLTAAELNAANFLEANLSRASLNNARLHVAVLRLANLELADLRGADLRGADLRSADLTDADLRSADLAWADLRGADLTGARFGEARLNEANLGGASLSGADFTDAFASGTQFVDVDLSVAKGLDTITHRRPSTVGLDTIHRSRGVIPEIFLRGCGVSDDLIGYIKSVAGAIQFYSCFISYSTKDQEFADRLYADLQNKGVRCWFAPHDIQGGRKIHEQLDEAIRLHDKLLLILSDHSMNSPWVKTEILRAQRRESEENKSPTLSSKDDDKGRAPVKRVLFPITLVPYAALEKWEYPVSSGVDLAEEIRQYFIPDFSNWKEHGSYREAFERLVKDLKAGAGV